MHTVALSLTVTPAILVSNLPSDQTLEAISASGAVGTYTKPSATESGATLTTTCVPASGSMFPLGTNVVTCTSSDGTNSLQSTFNVTVRDTTGPALHLPSTLNAEATSSAGATVTYAPSATDLVDGLRPVTCTPASGSLLPLGITPVSCTSTDSHNNTSNGAFNVNVQDTTPPALQCPANTTVKSDTSDPVAVSYDSATASDAVSSVTLAYSAASGTLFPNGQTVVTVTASDAAGNTSHCTFDVRVNGLGVQLTGGFGCSSGGSPSSLFGLLGLGFLALRRRAGVRLRG